MTSFPLLITVIEKLSVQFWCAFYCVFIQQQSEILLRLSITKIA